ncbi:MAG: hypothetical protein B1H13_04290 [Desulfobacteraceae bacterium 4484_190.3]|nr:MAG: hypothetical protein B1H13_04290 [Desulfobacteraceae bacterium 4484_190.3]
MRFNLPVCADRYAQIATAFGLAEKNEELSAERLVDEVHAMSRRINIPRFIDLGIDPAQRILMDKSCRGLSRNHLQSCST